MTIGTRGNNETPRRTSITETALLKFRQHASGFVGSDQQVMEALDDAVIDGFAAGTPEQYVTEEGDDAWLVDLEGQISLPLYGVVKHYRDREGRVDLNRKALVTIMKKEFVDKLKSSGQWNRNRSVVKEARRNKPSGRQEDQEGEAGLLRLVTWKQGDEFKTREVPLERLTAAVMALIAEGIAPSDIKIWRPLKLDVSVRVAG